MSDLGVIVKEIYKDLRVTAYKITKCNEAANDLTHDVILKMYDNHEIIGRLHQEKKLNFWLYRVMSNCYTDKFRDSPSYVQLTKDIPLEEDESNASERLYQIYTKLPEIERLWLNAYIAYDFNYLEIERATAASGGKISRQHASKEIKRIMNKIRDGV